MEVASLEPERRVHRLADLARHGENVVRTREIGREHRKGVSTEPRHGVAFAYGALQAVGDHSQQRIARAAAVALVDQLEAIQVQDQQRRRPARAPGVRDRLQGAVAEQVAVRQAGQRIVVRQILQARFVGLSLPYVARDRREKAYLPAGSPVRDDHLRDGDLRPVGAQDRRFAGPRARARGDRRSLALDQLARPRGIDLARRLARALRFRRADQFAPGGVQIGDRSRRVGHADVVAGRLEDLHQARALLLRDAYPLAFAHLGQGAFHDRAEPPHVVLQYVIGRTEPHRLDRPLLADRARQEDERNPRGELLRKAQRIDPVEARHREIGKDRLRFRRAQRPFQILFEVDSLP